jgi:hypothetical protein
MQIIYGVQIITLRVPPRGPSSLFLSLNLSLFLFLFLFLSLFLFLFPFLLPCLDANNLRSTNNYLPYANKNC